MTKCTANEAIYIKASIDDKNWIEVLLFIFCVEGKIYTVSGTIVERVYNMPGIAICFEFLFSKRIFKRNDPYKYDLFAELNMTVMLH